MSSEYKNSWRRQPPAFNLSFFKLFTVANRVRIFSSWLRRIAPDTSQYQIHFERERGVLRFMRDLCVPFTNNAERAISFAQGQAEDFGLLS